MGCTCQNLSSVLSVSEIQLSSILGSRSDKASLSQSSRVQNYKTSEVIKQQKQKMS